VSDLLDDPIDNRLLSAAFALAALVHATQKRKGDGQVPYLSHLMGVAALVMEQGGSDVEVAVALLHDAVEDGGGAEVAADIEAACGAEVTAIVLECSDSTADTTNGGKKLPWADRKVAYIGHLGGPRASDSARLVSACDKVHNLTATVTDVRRAPDPAAVWALFKTGWQGQVWYYRQLQAVYETSTDHRVRAVAGLLGAQLAELKTLLRSAGHDPDTAVPPFLEHP
jgi:(p)ppGpp synthase/HD superfamily hydrolase